MKVLLLGSGGREHALAWALRKSPRVTTVLCAPGNAGIAEIAECARLDISNHAQLIAFARERAVDFIVIGPEAPLVAGLGDALAEAGIRHFGPSRAAAQLEGSKGFTKDLCRDLAIPTGAYGRFTARAAAHAYLAAQTDRVVVKADGLAAGKGVFIPETMAEAAAAIDACFDGAFGAAGAEVVIEEFLEGEEASFFALSDGSTAIALGAAQDHKRVGDRDTGPNTGGMGAYSPVSVMTPEMIERTMSEIIAPTVTGMRARGMPFKGVLFAGLMITASGPKLIEYNVRFGDPECQVLMMRLETDLLDALEAVADERLSEISLRLSSEAALTVVMAAEGYPGSPRTGTEIKGLDAAGDVEGVTVFHAGTKREQGKLVAAGGRVLNVTARAPTVREAGRRAYAAIDRIDWPEGFCRRDIGWRAIARES